MKTINNLIEEIRFAPTVREAADLKKLIPHGTQWQEHFNLLQAYAEEAGWRVGVNEDLSDTSELILTSKHDLANVLALTDLFNQVIWVKEGSPNTKAYALVHELGHTKQPKTFVFYPRGYGEMFAESVAYLAFSELAPEWKNPISPIYLKNWSVPARVLREFEPKLLNAARNIAIAATAELALAA